MSQGSSAAAMDTTTSLMMGLDASPGAGGLAPETPVQMFRRGLTGSALKSTTPRHLIDGFKRAFGTGDQLPAPPNFSQETSGALPAVEDGIISQSSTGMPNPAPHPFFTSHNPATNEHRLLVRYVDDWLFISSNMSEAERFIAVMQRGFDSYGVRVGKDKTRTSFHVSGSTQALVHDGHMTYCGFNIDTRTFEVQKDFARWAGVSAEDQFTMDYQNPGQSILRKLKFDLGLKFNALQFDGTINSPPIVRINMYHCALTTAIRFHCLVKKLPLINQEYLKGVIESTVEHLWASLCICKSRWIKPAGSYCPTTKDETLWLGRHAFFTILSRKQSRYSEILPSLHSALYTQEAKSRNDGVWLQRLEAATDEKHSEVILKEFHF